LQGANNELGGIYGKVAPKINAALPPLSWQTYDIWYTQVSSTSSRFTVYLNGVLVQDDVTVNGETQGGSNNQFLFLQNHDDKSEVVFKNIWVVPNATTQTLTWNNIIKAAIPVSLKPTIQEKGSLNGQGAKILPLDVLGRLREYSGGASDASKANPAKPALFNPN
jgi:hypothetical protein